MVDQVNLKNLPLRLGVGIAVINQDNKVFVAKRIDNPKNYWQMPQGGIDDGENDYDAALRELKEETSIINVSLIKEVEGFISYELPDYLLGIIWKGKFRGQKQKWFIMRFNGKDNEINIQTKKPEFFEWKWINVDNLTKVAVPFKLEVYKKLETEIQKIINKDLPIDDPKQRCPDIDIANRELGWEPSFDRERGLKKTIEYFEKLLEKEKLK